MTASRRPSQSSSLLDNRFRNLLWIPVQSSFRELFPSFPLLPSVQLSLPLFLSALCFLLSASLATAQTKSAPVTAEISVSKDQLYERETFLFTLTIKTEGVQIRQKLDLEDLPDKRLVDMFTAFETLPTKRIGDGHRITEIHSYRCKARAMTPGSVRIAPTLKLVAMRRRRLFIGSAWEELPLTVALTPIELTVKTPPQPPPDFSGVIGTATLEASIDPSDIAPGDLVNLRTRISGEAYMEDISVPQVTQRPQLKVYDPKRVHSDPGSLIYEQIIIPQTADIAAIPAVSLTYFDTEEGSYKTLVGGPFPITFHDAPAATLEHFRPSDTSVSQSPTNQVKKEGLGSRIRTALGRARYEQGITHGISQARMAPSASSMATFEMPDSTEVDILRHHDGWALVASKNRRGWIPRSLLQDVARE